MMKKWICLALCLLMVSGCALAYDGTAPIAEEPITISVLTTNPASLLTDFANMTWWQEALKRANVVLEVEMIDPSSYADVIKPRLAAGIDLPDLVYVGSKDEDMAYVNSGLFLDLTEYYDTMAFNLNKRFEEYPTLKSQLTTPDGSIYYIPYILTTDSNMRTMMLNAQFVEAVGMTMEEITDIDSYTEYLYKVKEMDANGNGDPDDEVPLFLRGSGYLALLGMYWGMDLGDSGGFRLDENGAVVCDYVSEEYREFLEWAHQLYADGIIYNEFATSSYDIQQALLTSNQIGSMAHFISNMTGYSQTINPEWEFNVDEPIMQAVALSGPYSGPVVYGRDAFGSCFAISATCEHPEEVFAFCDYLMSDEVGVLTWYGIEGVDYNIVDGEYVFTDLYLNNEDDYLGKAGYNFSGLPSYQLDYMSKQCDQVRQQALDLAPYVYNPTIPFYYKLEEENEIINAYKADLDTYFSENLVAFVMGTRSLDEWDAYVSTVESMGLSELVSVYQAAADRAAQTAE